jgi:7-carboxy-7-deazaguanine synthase
VTEPTLVVSEVFGPTVQGEGPSLGKRAAFLRLGRCNLDCRWCDTPFTWNWDEYDPAVELSERPVDEVVEQIAAMGVDRVVLTGGEPLLQQRRLLPFLVIAAERGWTIEVETNGTLAPTDDTARLVAQFNVSPKLANSGVAVEKAIVPAALAALLATGKAAFKFVATGAADLDEVQAIVDANDLDPVWIMPEGVTPDVVLAGGRALVDAVTGRGWHLTTRLHVLLWGDERGR